MSFILDALRKSETERQQQTGPGLVNGQYRAPKTGKNIWIPLLVIVLAANVVILAWLMNAEAPDSGESARPVARENTPTPVESAEIRPLARELINSQRATVAEPVQTRNADLGPPEPAIRGAGADALNAADTAEAGTIQEGLPNLQQLVLAGELSVQPMHLDIHVYSKTRTERFIFINMKKYKEGDILVEGPSVEEITSTGAILRYRGNRFTIERD
ncbi:MAG: general secretion pathway protein GspB [Gammaproteobacteria bacterium]|nr:general secretion pathway protein GspB [Gammaproteobacteria bacterium]